LALVIFLRNIKMSDQKVASEKEWLEWFYSECDFGPAHEDVILELQQRFEKTTGERVPRGYRQRDESDYDG
jgi:hypothetical protein